MNLLLKGNGRKTIWVVLFIASCVGMPTVLMWGQTTAGQGSAAASRKLPELEVASIRYLSRTARRGKRILVAAVDRFTAGAPQSDDLTLVVLNRPAS